MKTITRFLLILLMSVAASASYGQAAAQLAGAPTPPPEAAATDTAKKVELAEKRVEEKVRNNLSLTRDLLEAFGVATYEYDKPAFGKITYLALMGSGALFAASSLFAVVILFVVYPLLHKLGNRGKMGFVKSIAIFTRGPIAAFLYTGIFYASFFNIAYDLGLVYVYEPVFWAIYLAIILWACVKVFDSVTIKFEHMGERKFGYKEVMPIIRKTLRYLFIIGVVLYFLDKVGVDVNGFMVSLGIGGAALAFASKDTIANFFGSVSLIMDEPFKIGDRIQVAGKLDGTVESIGLRSTRIINLDMTVSILPNSYLANEYITNVSRWKSRRVSFDVGLTYATTAAQIKQIVSDIEKILDGDNAVSKELGYTVAFSTFGASSLNVSVLYFTTLTDYENYIKTIERINFEIMAIVEARGSSFAFPSTSLYIEKK